MVRCSVSPGREYNGREEQEKRKRSRVKRDRRRAGKTSLCRLFFTGKKTGSYFTTFAGYDNLFPSTKNQLDKEQR